MFRDERDHHELQAYERGGSAAKDHVEALPFMELDHGTPLSALKWNRSCAASKWSLGPSAHAPAPHPAAYSACLAHRRARLADRPRPTRTGHRSPATQAP